MPPDDAYTMMQQGVDDQAMSDPGMDPQMAAPPMDLGAMSTLFGDDGQEAPVDDGSGQEMPVDDGSQGMATDQAPDQAGGGVDQDRLQAVLSDPDLLMAVAQTLKTLGTGEDTDLVHVTEQEKAMLKQGGGMGTPNPTTGLLQYTMPLRPGEVPGQPYSGDTHTKPPEDWYGMHPDERVARIASRGIGVPGWNNNWWTQPHEATAGGMTRNMTGEDFANANVAVKPSWGTAMNMAGLVTGMMGGPLAALVSYGGKALTSAAIDAIFGKDSLLGSGDGAFNTPGGRLPPDAVARIAAAYNNAAMRNLPAAQVMNAATTQAEVERAAYGGGEGAQTGGVGQGMSGGIGTDKAGHAYGTNIGGAGVSHNLAAAGPATSTDAGVQAARTAAGWAAANAARAFAAGGFGRAVAAGSGGDGGRGGSDGGGRSDGGNRGGGQEGGRHGGPGGSNRSD